VWRVWRRLSVEEEERGEERRKKKMGGSGRVCECLLTRWLGAQGRPEVDELARFSAEVCPS
jgi:hypothetical protein